MISSFALFIVFLFQVTFYQLTAISYINAFITFIGIVIFKYLQQNEKRKLFIAQQDNKKWIEVIEKVFPTWVVILKYDKATTMIQMDKANYNFLKEFDIVDDFTFRKRIRNWKVVPEQLVQQNLKINAGECINYESLLLKDLTSHSIQNQNKIFYAFQIDNFKQRIFKITQVQFSSFQAHILLHLEEIKENKFEDLTQQIIFRDRLIVSHTGYNLSQQASIIAFLKTLRSGMCKVIRVNAFIKNCFREEILESIFRFNNLLNIRALILINYNFYRYNMDIIQLSYLKDLLRRDIGIKEIVVEKKRSSKLMIKRSTSQANPELINTIRNDKQKLVQVILTTVQFIKTYTPIQSIQFQIKQTKKNPQHYKFKFYSADLKIPIKIQHLVNQNWAQSAQNKNRWNFENHFKKLKQLIELFSSTCQHPSEPLNDKYPGLFWNGVPLAQYLLGQLGPFNMYFFKDNQIKFFIYQDLDFMIQEINSIEPNPSFKLITLKD